jgi:hypothetical protein
MVPMLFYYYHTSSLSGHLGVYKNFKTLQDLYMAVNGQQQSRTCLPLHGLQFKQAQKSRSGLLASEALAHPFHKLFTFHVGKVPCSKSRNAMMLVLWTPS